MLSSVLQKLPLVIAGAMFAVAVVTIYIRSRHVTRNEFVHLCKSVKLLTTWVLIFTFVLTGVFAVCNHIKEKQHRVAVVALNYSEASAAQNTNGTRFNMTEIICDEVVERAIRLGAFENVTVKQLRDCLSVYPYVQGDVDDESNYHISTEFVVEYNASKHTSHLDSENVILLVTMAYKDYYIEAYTDSFRLTGLSGKPDYASMEYMDIVTYLNKSATSVLNYLYGMAEKAPSFVTSSGASFGSIAGKVHQFKSTQIGGNLRSLILQHGVVRDKQTYLDRLASQKINTDFTKQKHIASLDVCNATIDMYSVEMTRVVLVPTKDYDGTYYMGRTNVGIDELSVMATSFSDLIAENEKKLMDSNLVIQKIQEAEDVSVYAAQADEMIATIDETLTDLTVEAIAAGREYADYKMNQCIAISVSGSSLIDELKTIAVFAVLAYISAMAYDLSKKFPKA